MWLMQKLDNISETLNMFLNMNNLGYCCSSTVAVYPVKNIYVNYLAEGSS